MKTKLFNISINLGKDTLIVGKKVPQFEFETTSGKSYSNVSLLGKRYIISTFPNVNTKVCKVQTRNMIKEFSSYDNTVLFNLAHNTKADFDSWCAVEGLDAIMVSDVNLDLARTFGLKLPLMKMYARAVFVVDENSYVRYIEVMKDIRDEPDYKALKDHLLSLE